MSKGLGQKIGIKFTEILVGDVTGLVPTHVDRGDYFRPIGVATGSSQYSSYAPSNAFDGSTSNYWYTITTGDQWVQIELAEPTWVYGFRWYIGSSYRPNGFNFQGSNDGEIWEDILINNSPNATGWHEFPTDSPKQYKYYRWTVTSRYSDYLRVNEIELLGAVGNEVAFTITGKEYQYVNGPLIDVEYPVDRVERYGVVPIWSIVGSSPSLTDVVFNNGFILDSGEISGGGSSENLAYGKTYFAKGTLSGFPMSNAFDGDINTFWRDSGGVPSWLTVDLGESIIVTKINMAGISTRIKDFILQGSTDSSTWVNVYTGQQTNDNVLRSYEFVNDNSYRYYRIYISSVWSTGYGPGLSELELYSTSYQYLSEGILISAINVTGDYRVRWLEDKPTGTDITIEYTTGIIQGEWIEVSNGEVITSDTNLWFRVTLETTDTSVTPTLQDLWIERPDVPDDQIRLVMHPQGRFNNVEGPLTVSYDSSKGNMVGKGGAVESFDAAFMPTDLVPLPNPSVDEKILMSIGNVGADFIKVYYRDRYVADSITTTMDVSVVFTYVGIINP